MSLLKNIGSQLLKDAVVNQIAGKLGSNGGAVKSAIGMALPALLGGLQRNSAKPDGASALLGALDRDHDGSILDNIAGLLGNPQASKGSGILKHVLGQKRSSVEQLMGATSGLDSNQAAGLMEILAPMVMGSIGKERRSNNLDANGLASLLSGAQKEMFEAPETDSKGLGFIGKMLDADGDGNLGDDMARMGKNILGNLFNR